MTCPWPLRTHGVPALLSGEAIIKSRLDRFLVLLHFCQELVLKNGTHPGVDESHIRG